MWAQRENLIAILNAIKSSPRYMQLAKNKQYRDTEAELQKLETKMGMPFDAAADAIQRMEVAMFQPRSNGMVKQYNAAVKDFRKAIRDGPPIPSGMFKSFIVNKGPSMEQTVDLANAKNVDDYNKNLWKTEQLQDSADYKERNARHDYEA